MLEHGGRLLAMSQQYGIAPAQWLDLSTGIHPSGWPVPPLPPECWRRLPEDEDGLQQAAAAYYGSAQLAPCAGSQAVIQTLPAMRAPCRVGILGPTYAEHAHAWRQAGHSVTEIAEYAPHPAWDVLLLVNPNNPTGRLLAPASLLAWHAELAGRGGWLVVDEAFMDATPQHSLAAHAGLPGLVILRSLGKFFGLAGIRAGFVLAWPELLRQLQEKLGPWSVPHPSRAVAQLALRDSEWQAEHRLWLAGQSRKLAALLTRHGLPPSGGTALFQYVPNPQADELQHRLARVGILTRLFAQPAALRFGLPASAVEFERLAAALSQVTA